jgi:hypothetical protein
VSSGGRARCGERFTEHDFDRGNGDVAVVVELTGRELQSVRGDQDHALRTARRFERRGPPDGSS